MFPSRLLTFSWVPGLLQTLHSDGLSRLVSSKLCQSTFVLGAEPNYDNLQACSAWAIESLDKHRSDKREFIYTLCAPRAVLSPQPLMRSHRKWLRGRVLLTVSVLMRLLSHA